MAGDKCLGVRQRLCVTFPVLGRVIGVTSLYWALMSKQTPQAGHDQAKFLVSDVKSGWQLTH